jgi:hypothetical protein
MTSTAVAKFVARIGVGLRRRGWRGGIACLSAGVACVACNTGSGGELAASKQRSRAGVAGAVVSTVDTEPITLSEVEALAAHGLPADEALSRLQAEALLMAEAERRGLQAHDEVRWVERQALVQALLASETQTVRVSEADVRRLYDERKSEYGAVEKRVCVHLAVLLPKKASPEAEASAAAFVRERSPELAAAVDLDAFVRAHDETTTPGGLRVVAERLPPIDRKANIAAPYIEALFSLERVGAVSKPVRTSHGFHAIRLTEVIKTPETPFHRVFDQLHAELLQRAQKQHVEQFVARLRAEQRVEIAAEVRERLAGIGRAQ